MDDLEDSAAYDIANYPTAPLNEYAYGLLLVFHSGRYAMTQIYIPHSPKKYAIVLRNRYGGTAENWGVWIGITYSAESN